MVNVTNITYVNSRVSNAIIATPSERFGRSHMREASDRLRVQQRELEHIRGALPVKPNSVSLVADAPRGVRPPEHITSRTVVATRRPQEAKLPWRTETTGPMAAKQHYVPAPKPAVTELRRPELGTQTGPERARPPLPPRYEDWKRRAEPVAPSAVVREQGAVGRIESKPTRIAPPETAIPSRGRELAPPSSAQVPVSPERQPQLPRIEAAPQPARVTPPETATPSRAGRGFTPPSPAPVRIAPQTPRIEAAPQEARPWGARTDLPGIPANRTYRGGNQGKSEREHPQR